MAAAQERLLRRRIRSIQAIRKTTRAMELIASSRIQRAQHRISGARPYSEAIRRICSDLAAAAPTSRWASGGQAQGPRVVVVMAGDRGLSGAYNLNVVRAAEAVLEEGAVSNRVVAVGKRTGSYLRFRGVRLSESFVGVAERPSFEDASRIGAAALEILQEQGGGRLDIISTRWRSMGSQYVERRQVLPLDPRAGVLFDYEVEPEAEDALELMVPQLVRSEIFIALLEAAASEHAARRRAMMAATENADELVQELTRQLNRVRQDTITTEIMDIIGGAEALRKADEATSVERLLREVA
jgi:F-type H+-transporting ATPase subunit gamma